jgi:hypothetical protein
VPFAKINLNQDFNLYELRSLDTGLAEFWQRFGKRKIGTKLDGRWHLEDSQMRAIDSYITHGRGARNLGPTFDRLAWIDLGIHELWLHHRCQPDR